MPFQLSPGVAVVEKDFTSIVPAVSSSIGAFAGAFPWGPVMEPTTVGSENELVRRFGKPNDSNFNSFFTAANFLSYTNNLLLVRADAGHLNAVATPTGGLGTVTVTAAGSGYSSIAAAPTVTVGAPQEVDGTQAVVTATLSGGTVTAIAVATAGVGYATAPAVTITPAAGDTGSGATATAVLTLNAPTVAQSLTITVTDPGSGDVFVVDGVNKPIIPLVRGGVYTFIQSAASNSGHQIAFKDSGGTTYTEGVVTTGTPGTAGAQTVFTVPNSAPADLRYYCVAHGNDMGNTITVTGTGLLGTITGITVTSAGSGYKATPTVTLSGGTPTTAATLGAVTLSSSTITGLTITTVGTGYTSAPTLTIAAPPSGTLMAQVLSELGQQSIQEL
jgi:hypothetical protein